MIVDCAIYQDGRRVEGAPDVTVALREARTERHAFLWLGLHEPTPEEFDKVSREFGLHPLAVEDALKAHQRPKLEVYDDSLFLVLKPVVYDAPGDTVATEELMIFLGDSFVVTVRHGEGSPLASVRHRLEREPEVLRQGPTAVLYAISDAVVDHYIDVAGELQIDLEELETEVFAPEAVDRNTAARIYTFKRQIVEFRRATVPLTDPMTQLTHAALPFVDDSARPFFRDVGDHLTRANESVEGLDRLLSDVLAAHLAQTGVRQNDDMRKISAWAAMAAIPTMVAGIYGMNFEHMPELESTWGYPVVLVLMGLAIAGLFRAFKRQGWL
ncbi:magnesium/cobalt transporter CorA [Streptomyces sp. WAC 00631]|uniref:magnesium/cobalt transporter CorA n=1 Tax=unclassified Streptomyces TaxID=2593676 RepID=UPI000F79546C|nr:MULTISPECIES: magnesium/cobalt transporter CorA [unclassified Streptomyces]MCC5034188.1 magnesium/cobalt transporter CorA [Streptomyces sp. WAC 00631]MCC9742429.1 magnesium/cobalt transporter CorA [Streptomyces sp. MNU89]